MLRLSAVVVPLVVVLGCASGETNNISLTEFFIDSACTLPPPTSGSADGGSASASGGQWLRGSLEVVSGVPPAFRIGMGLTSTLGGVGGDLTVAGTTLDTAGRDHPILDALVVTLKTTPPLTFSTTPYTVPIFANFDTSNQAWIGFPNIIGPKEADVLAAIDPTRTYELSAQIELRGTMSRSGAAVSSGHYAFFPIGVSTYANPPGSGSTDCNRLGHGIGCFAPGTFGAPACCDGLAGCN